MAARASVMTPFEPVLPGPVDRGMLVGGKGWPEPLGAGREADGGSSRSAPSSSSVFWESEDRRRDGEPEGEGERWRGGEA